MVLGIGGVRAIWALGLNPSMYHFNEGHALFAGFEYKENCPVECASVRPCRKRGKKWFSPPIHLFLKGNEQHPIDRLIYMGANPKHDQKAAQSYRRDPST